MEFNSFWKSLFDKSRKQAKDVKAGDVIDLGVGDRDTVASVNISNGKVVIVGRNSRYTLDLRDPVDILDSTQKEAIAKPFNWDDMVASAQKKIWKKRDGDRTVFKNLIEKGVSINKDGGVSMGGTPEATGSTTGDYENSELRLIDPYDSGAGLGETKKDISSELKQAERYLERLSSSWNGEDDIGMFEGSKVHWEDAIGEAEDKVSHLKRLQSMNRTKSRIDDYLKDVGVAYAGPVPNTLLAAQDLEGGDSSTTTKGVDKKNFIIYSTNEGNGLEFWVKDYQLGIEVGSFKTRQQAEKYVNSKVKKSQFKKDSQKHIQHTRYKGHDIDKFVNEESGFAWYVVDDMQMSGIFDVLTDALRAIDKGQFGKSHPDPKDDPENRKPNDETKKARMKSVHDLRRGEKVVGYGRIVSVQKTNKVGAKGDYGFHIMFSSGITVDWNEFAQVEMDDSTSKSQFIKTCVLEHIDSFLAEEVDAQEGYRQAAQETSNLEIAELLNQIADDELGHQDVLQEIKDMEKFINIKASNSEKIRAKIVKHIEQFFKENYHNGEGYISQEVLNRNEKVGYQADPPVDSQTSVEIVPIENVSTSTHDVTQFM